jgi:hypothetical protein
MCVWGGGSSESIAFFTVLTRPGFPASFCFCFFSPAIFKTKQNEPLHTVLMVGQYWGSWEPRGAVGFRPPFSSPWEEGRAPWLIPHPTPHTHPRPQVNTKPWALFSFHARIFLVTKKDYQLSPRLQGQAWEASESSPGGGGAQGE